MIRSDPALSFAVGEKSPSLILWLSLYNCPHLWTCDVITCNYSVTLHQVWLFASQTALGMTRRAHPGLATWMTGHADSKTFTVASSDDKRLQTIWLIWKYWNPLESISTSMTAKSWKHNTNAYKRSFSCVIDVALLFLNSWRRKAASCSLIFIIVLEQNSWLSLLPNTNITLQAKLTKHLKVKPAKPQALTPCSPRSFSTSIAQLNELYTLSNSIKFM